MSIQRTGGVHGDNLLSYLDATGFNKIQPHDKYSTGMALIMRLANSKSTITQKSADVGPPLTKANYLRRK